MIRYGEIGKGIYVDASFDLSANTELTLKFNLGGQVFTRNTGDGVVAPAVDSPALAANPSSGFPGGVLPANTYALYVVGSGDWADSAFNSIGDWGVCLTYEDAAPSRLYGDEALITIEEGC